MPLSRGDAGTLRTRPRHRGDGYFLFLRWIRVFFSSLRCFFFAIRLRRFLMTEPIRPPSLRHNGRRARHRSPLTGRLGARPKYREKRERQSLTQSSSLPAAGRPCYEPGLLRRPDTPTGAPAAGLRVPYPNPAEARHPQYGDQAQAHLLALRAVPVSRAQSPVLRLGGADERGP